MCIYVPDWLLIQVFLGKGATKDPTKLKIMLLVGFSDIHMHEVSEKFLGHTNIFRIGY